MHFLNELHQVQNNANEFGSLKHRLLASASPHVLEIDQTLELVARQVAEKQTMQATLNPDLKTAIRNRSLCGSSG
jgi:hypothetical protein